MQALHIDGSSLTFDALREVVYERRAVLLAPDAREAVERARGVVEDLLAGDQVAYAVNTGVGKLSDVRIAPEQIRELQENLMRSHCVGVGEPLAEAEVRAMMLLRANSLAQGHSGVRPAIIDTFCEMLNRGVHPVVPSQGSVGASGDLAPLAHLGIVLMGEGEAVFGFGNDAKKTSGAGAMKAAGVKTLTLEAKEAISLINGTQAMLAIGALTLLAAETLADSADVIGALSLDALRGTDAAFDERIHAARPHPGQIKTAANLRKLLAGSDIRESHRDCARVQDAYSLRCMPQVHGAVRDAFSCARETFAIEMNSAVDNPLVFADKRTGKGDVVSGGNFHGEPLAFALDFLAIALAALAGISERRLERLVNPALNEGLPPFLAPEPAGLNSGFMMAQVTAAALVSENKVLAHPASVDSITTSGNKEDYVSMGMGAALKLRQVLANVTNVLAIEALAAAQALDHLAPLRTSARLEKAHAAIRAVSARVVKDRNIAADIPRLGHAIRQGELLAPLR
ncbi:MAG: histidine ammonia-lyase [Acidobacteriota bacterium]|nr:histidine ammonia-lyase [Acidobacteriota bacterium]